MSAFALNPGMFMMPQIIPVSAWTGHIPMAGWLVYALRPRMLVELGTHAGASFFAFCQATRASGHEGRCYAVDTWQGDEHAGHYDETVHDAVRDHLAEHYAGFASMMRMTFDEAAPYFADGSIDLLHIDGLHTYEAVRHDFETWFPKMSVRGVILFHDTCVRERDFGVWKLWAELKGRYPSFEFTHTHGLGILGVGGEAESLLASLWAAAADSHAAASVNTLFEFLGNGITRRQQIGDLLQRQAHLDGDNGHLRNLLDIREAEHAAREHDCTLQIEQAEERSRELETRLERAAEEAGTAFASLHERAENAEMRLREAASLYEQALRRADELEGQLRGQLELLEQGSIEVAARDARIIALEQAFAAAQQRLIGVERSIGWRISALLGSLLPPYGNDTRGGKDGT